MFPLLMDQKEWDDKNISKLNIPKTLPIEFIKQYEKQIHKNHDQTVEKLAERGGLHPTELVAAIYGMDLATYFGKRPMTTTQTVFSISMIAMKLNDFQK